MKVHRYEVRGGGTTKMPYFRLDQAIAQLQRLRRRKLPSELWVCLKSFDGEENWLRLVGGDQPYHPDA